MADIDTNNAIMEVTSHEGELDRGEESVNVMDGSIGDQADEDVCEEDILQQAFVEASSFPDGVQIQYTSNGVGLQEGNIINPADEGTTFITTGADGQISAVQLGEQFENGSYQILVSNDGANDQFAGDSIVAVQNGTTVQFTQGDNMEPQYVHVDSSGNIVKADAKEDDQGQLVDESQFNEVAEGSGLVEDPDPESKSIQQTVTSAAPLGSSGNPIRIIQSGNQYTPVQQLSPEQLQQIMQVVQQQQITKSLDTGNSVLYNQQTNTRIVYRVIYPSDLHKDGSGDGMRTKDRQSIGVQGVPKRTYRKKIKEDEQDKIDGPELSKEEKEARKKQRAKTRSGRVSKPPKHMVKDYKQLHVLDYDEDYDDSDGGYSDYKVGEANNEEDQEPNNKHDGDNYIAPGLNSSKPKNWKCISCEKAYIGRAGLARHLKLYPSHGSIDPDGEGEMEPPPSGTHIVPTSLDDCNPGSLPGAPVTPNGINSAANSTASFSEDSRDSTYSLPYTPNPTPTPRPRGQRGRPRGSRSGWRGRGAYSKVDQEARRINKLKDITRECSDEELMEIVLPRLAKVITLWEFLLMKVEIDTAATSTPGSGGGAGLQADDVYREYEKLHQHVRKLCQEYLQYVPDMEARDDETSCLQIENSIVATALGLQVGRHRVKEIPDTDPAITYKHKFVTSNHRTTESEYSNKSILKRTVQVVSPEDMLVSPKRLKMSSMKSSPAILTAQNNVQSSSGAGLEQSSFLTNTLTRTPNSGTHSSQPRIMKLLSPISAASPTVTVNSNSVASLSTTGVILTNSLSPAPVILQAAPQVLPGVNPGPPPGSTSGTLPTSRTVSLLDNSKYLSSKPEPRKILILSGASPATVPTGVTNVAVPLSSATQAAGEPIIQSKPGLSHSALVQQPAATVSSHVSTATLLTGAVGQTAVASGAYIMPASLASSSPLKSQQPLTLLPMSSSGSQPILLSLPPSVSQPQLLHTKLMVTDPGATGQQVIVTNAEATGQQVMMSDPTATSQSVVTDPVATSQPVMETNPEATGQSVMVTDPGSCSQTDSAQSMISIPQQPQLNSQNQPEQMLDTDQVLNSVDNDASFITVDQAYHLNGDVKENESGELDSENVVYALQNGDADDFSVPEEDQSEANIVYTVDPEMVLVNKADSDNISIENNEIDSTKVLLSSNSEEVVGVLNSIDNTSTPNNMKMDAQPNTDNTDQIPKQSQMAATEDELNQAVDSDFTEFQQSDVQDTSQQADDGQPSATIFQTEDGGFFIQNSDGTTLQLQGTDGEPLTMETVQALLAMDGGTELITQQGDIT